MKPTPASSPLAVATRLSPAVAWILYLPLGAKYALALLGFLTAVSWLRRHRLSPRLDGPSGQPVLLALLGWLSLTTFWTPAPSAAVVAHLWTYSLALGLPCLITALNPSWCRQALIQFAAATAFVGGLVVLRTLDALPPSPLWASTIDATGNQRIATSMLMALGAVMALWLAAGRDPGPATHRAGLVAAAGLATLGLVLQDRRTGMLMLPLLLLVWALARQRGALRRSAAALAVLTASLLVWQGSDGVRTRFAEGWGEIAAYRSGYDVSTSWGMRLRMLELTVEMVRERPWTGHGVGSWETLWQRYTPSGTRLADNSTPHNDYLHLAQQGGAPALLLLLAFLGAQWRHGCRCGAAGVPMLLVWTAFSVGALFNAVLRDAKLALPLLLLAAAAAALARRADDDPPSSRPASAGGHAQPLRQSALGQRK